MPRSRNIKPSFFINDELANENSPLGRLLFIGMWTVADYNGNLEWRPARVKAQILAYDDCDINQLAIDLDKSGFIRFYSDGEKLLVNIPTFLDHQNPHKNERDKGTDLPPFTQEMRQLVDLQTLAIYRDLSRSLPEDSASNPADSCSLNPDSSNSSSSAGRFRMHMDWEPSKQFPAILFRSGVSPDVYLTDENLGEFKSYWMRQERQMDHGGWEHKLLQALQRRKLHDKQTPPDGPGNGGGGVGQALRNVDDKSWMQGFDG